MRRPQEEPLHLLDTLEDLPISAWDAESLATLSAGLERVSEDATASRAVLKRLLEYDTVERIYDYLSGAASEEDLFVSGDRHAALCFVLGFVADAVYADEDDEADARRETPPEPVASAPPPEPLLPPPREPEEREARGGEKGRRRVVASASPRLNRVVGGVGNGDAAFRVPAPPSRPAKEGTRRDGPEPRKETASKKPRVPGPPRRPWASASVGGCSVADPRPRATIPTPTPTTRGPHWNPRRPTTKDARATAWRKRGVGVADSLGARPVRASGFPPREPPCRVS